MGDNVNGGKHTPADLRPKTTYLCLKVFCFHSQSEQAQPLSQQKEGFLLGRVECIFNTFVGSRLYAAP